MVLNRCRWFDRMYRLVPFLINTYGTEMNPLDGGNFVWSHYVNNRFGIYQSVEITRCTFQILFAHLLLIYWCLPEHLHEY